MARPEKQKMIGSLPHRCRFSASSENDPKMSIILSLEEFETIRQIDYLGMTQEQCALQMKVGRGTVQSLYSEARRKIARFLIEDLNLMITGGNFALKTSHNDVGSKSNSQSMKGKSMMKIAVTFENGEVFQHFGQTTHFKIFDIEDHKIVKSSIIDSNGAGHGALVGLLQGFGVTTLICGGIGGGARNAFAEIGLEVISGAVGPVDQQVESFLSGHLETSEEHECHHEGSHHEGHGEGAGNCHGGGCGHGH